MLAAADQYQRECLQRSAQATAAARRDDLADQLAAVQAAEDRAARDAQERGEAAQNLLAAARACGITTETPDRAHTALTQWLAQRAAQMEEASDAEREWAELRALLAGRSLLDLQQAATAAQEKAVHLAAGVDPTVIATVDSAAAAEALPELRREAAATATSSASAEGALEQFAITMGSVAEAEEAAEQAAAELFRVHELADTIARARSFLAAAQDRVHRDIAPVLAATVKLTFRL